MRALPEPGRFVAALLLAAWLGAAVTLGYVLLWLPTRAEGRDGRDFPVQVSNDANVDDVAELLAREHVASHPRVTAFYLRVLGADQHLRRGAVVLNRRLSLRDHLPRIALGYGSAEVQVTFPEGFTRFDVATRLARFGIVGSEEFVAISADRSALDALGIQADSAEGYLFPASYRLLQDNEPRVVLARMVRVFHERTKARFAAYAELHAADPITYTPHELLVLASMVEREAQAADERATIAGVFFNRLRDPTFKPKRLQSDPTVAYGCLVAPDSAPSCAEFDGRRVTPAMVRDPENAYSTYKREGLPPGPIANPGLSSLDAVLTPANHDYFYFVAKGGGRHAFSHGLSEHNQRVRREP